MPDIRHGRLSLIVPGDDIRVCYEIFVLSVYDWLNVQSGDNVLDAGAGIGDFAVRTAVSNPSTQVIALEPDPTYYEILLRNLKRNNVTNCIPLELALSDSRGASVIRFGDLRRTPAQSVKTTTIDDVAQDLGIPQFDVVKMDIEGMEENVFQKSSWLNRTRELAIETHWDSYDSIVANLKDHGFEVSSYNLRRMMKNVLAFTLFHPREFLKWEVLSKGLGTKRALAFLLDPRNPPDQTRETDFVLHIVYARRNSPRSE